jgi:hypothetical protein
MSFGGLLGIGERYHPLPWATLKYDTRQGGYVVGLTIDQLQGAPTFSANEMPAWGDRAYEARIHDYYKTARIGAREHSPPFPAKMPGITTQERRGWNGLLIRRVGLDLARSSYWRLCLASIT